MDLTPASVVLVSTQRHWHGGEEQARLLAVGLKRRGIECIIFARRGGRFAERMEAEGFQAVRFSGNGLSPASLWRIRRELRKIRPDVLHFNDPHALTAAGIASLRLPIPVKIAARRVDFPLHSPRRYLWLCNRLICVSTTVARVCRDGGIPDHMLKVVHDGVDPARVQSGDRRRGRQSLALTDEQMLLLCVSKLTDHKGHKYFLEAMPKVFKMRPNAVVALAGDGELREQLERQAESLGILEKIRFLGYRNDVPDLIHAADLFVFPSHMEGLGSSLIDVMLAERTIVTTSAGGIPDLVAANGPDDDAVAWIAATKDSTSLADEIIKAIESPQLCETMRRRARQRAELRFTADRMVESTLAVYRE